MDRLVLRDADPAEAAVLSGICRDAKAHWGYAHALLDAWAEALTFTAESIRRHPTRVAVLEGRVIGCSQLRLDEGPARLEHLWVAPPMMGRGIGRSLLEDARRRAGVVLQIEADPHAEAFYLRCGARRIARIPAPIEGDPRRFLPLMELLPPAG